MPDISERKKKCEQIQTDFFQDRSLIIAANRGPVTFSRTEEGEITFEAGGGGLVKALLGLCRYTESSWVACAKTKTDAEWGGGEVPLSEEGASVQIEFLTPHEDAYYGYYNVIANPLLWFLQHSMWDVPRTPIINWDTWEAWKDGYVAINRMFAGAIAEQIRAAEKPPVVMLQDYHLYLTADFVRQEMADEAQPTLTHFVHIPWPGPEYWRILPPDMRQAILKGLCAVDLLGFQTHDDGLNFIRTCESLLPNAEVNFREGQVLYNGHTTHIRDYPISIDVKALQELVETEETIENRLSLERMIGERKLILRVDRTEPSKNIVRGFQAFEELLEFFPEHQNKVIFVAILVPSRLGVDEYQDYLDELMAAAGRINANYGNSDWEPVRLLVGEDYPRAVAAMQLYDVLLVNVVDDGMNLVSKEGPTVNQRDGVLILSERAGSFEQLKDQALVVSPCDVYDTSEKLHQALTMPAEERKERIEGLRKTVAAEDITTWMCQQLEDMIEREL